MTLSEVQLGTLACRGDRVAFGQIVTRYHRPIYSLCLRYLRSTAEAEEVAQETFVRAFVHIASFDPSRPLLPWLMTIGRRLALDRLRQRRPSTSFDDEESGLELKSDRLDSEGELQQKQESQALHQALDKLGADQREVLMLFYFEGLSYQEIATTLEKPIGTIMTWLHRGKEALRQKLQTKGEQASEGRP